MNSAPRCIAYFPEFLAITETAVQHEDALAHWKLAIAILDGRYGEYDPHKAAQLLLEAASLGCHLAPYYLGDMVRNGLVSALEFGEAPQHWQRGAVMGHARSQYQWGMHLGTQAHIPLNLAIARHWLQLASWNGSQDAEMALAILIATGRVPTPVLAESVYYLESLLPNGDPVTLWARSRIPHSVGGRSYGPEESRRDLYQSARAGLSTAVIEVIYRDLPLDGENRCIENHFQELLTQKDPIASHVLAIRYLKAPHATRLQIQQGLFHLEEAIESGYWPAMHELADHYQRQGQLEEALRLYDRLAALGLTDAVAFDRAYVADRLGHARKSFDPHLLHCLSTGAYNCTPFLLSLSSAVYVNTIHPKADDLATFYTLTALQEGLPEAGRLLAAELLDKSAEQYDGIARLLLAHAGNNGDAAACHMLGDIYSVVTDCIHNPKLAYQWYLKAAEMGYHESVRRVIYCHVHNYGVEGEDAQITIWGRRLRELDLAAGYLRMGFPHTPEMPKEGKLIPFPLGQKSAGG